MWIDVHVNVRVFLFAGHGGSLGGWDEWFIMVGGIGDGFIQSL